MKSWTERPNIRPPGEQPSWLSLPILFGCIVVAGAIAAAVVCFTGCTGTVAPKIPIPTQASYDGTQQTSGIVSLTRDAGGHVSGAIVTPEVHAKFNVFAVTRGSTMTPPIPINFGFTARPDGNYDVTAEALVQFILWERLPEPLP